MACTRRETAGLHFSGWDWDTLGLSSTALRGLDWHGTGMDMGHCMYIKGSRWHGCSRARRMVVIEHSMDSFALRFCSVLCCSWLRYVVVSRVQLSRSFHGGKAYGFTSSTPGFPPSSLSFSRPLTTASSQPPPRPAAKPEPLLPPMPSLGPPRHASTAPFLVNIHRILIRRIPTP